MTTWCQKSNLLFQVCFDHLDSLILDNNTWPIIIHWLNGIYCEHIKHEKIMWCCDDGRDNNYSSLVVKSRRVLLMEVIIIIFFFILDWVPGRFSTDIIFMWLAGMQHHAAAACMHDVWRMASFFFSRCFLKTDVHAPTNKGIFFKS